MRQRSALQRAQQRWQQPRAASPLKVVAPIPPTRLERFNAWLWRIHDGPGFCFVLVAVLVIAAWLIGAQP